MKTIKKNVPGRDVNDEYVVIKQDDKLNKTKYKTVNINGNEILALFNTCGDLYLLKTEQHIRLSVFFWPKYYMSRF